MWKITFPLSCFDPSPVDPGAGLESISNPAAAEASRRTDQPRRPIQRRSQVSLVGGADRIPGGADRIPGGGE